MILITYNTNGAFRKKYHLLERFNWDILVIQECEDPARSKDKTYREWASNYLWTGQNKHKGLGVFAKSKVKLKRLKWQMGLARYFLPCRVNDDFNLLAVWCHLDFHQPKFNYSGQLWKFLQLHKAKLKTCILAGDFNAHPQFDRPSRHWNFSDSIEILRKKGITSLYHNYFGESHGEESQPTLYLLKNLEKPFHLDYVFASKVISDQVVSCQMMKPEEWLSSSDHMAMLVELDHKL